MDKKMDATKQKKTKPETKPAGGMQAKSNGTPTTMQSKSSTTKGMK